MAHETVIEAHDEGEKLNLHDAYHYAIKCGYTRDLRLHQYQAQQMASQLRGISSITAVLMTDSLDVTLGDWMRMGLVEAVHALANDSASILEHANQMAEKETLLAA